VNTDDYEDYAEPLSLFKRIEELETAVEQLRPQLERIALGIAGRRESGFLPNERDEHSGQAKPDWTLVKDLLSSLPVREDG
jgi:hypothetical protein